MCVCVGGGSFRRRRRVNPREQPTGRTRGDPGHTCCPLPIALCVVGQAVVLKTSSFLLVLGRPLNPGAELRRHTWVRMGEQDCEEADVLGAEEGGGGGGQEGC